uniref:Reverse transcriptase domain-containing protein n=1 Tax=Leptobrachium leishanense TaxID=445787 RepID=A0A8C5LVA2_9ANUR
MLPNKAPGPDSYTYRYYKAFLPTLKPFLCRLFNKVGNNTPFPAASLFTSITLIPKPGKDPEQVDNYSPISLLNTDIKLLAKILALHLDPLLPTLISPDQVGFIPGRQAYDNLRQAADLIWCAHTRRIPSLFLSLDAEKAFDRAEWPYLFGLLTHLGFPPAFVRVVGALYDSPSAQILIPGADRIPFGIWNGTRQGCSLSPALFALFLELLLHAIKLNPSVTGLNVGDAQYKLSAYADDVLLSLTNPGTSLPAVLKELENFSLLSSYKINVDKSEALPVALPTSDRLALTSLTSIKIVSSTITYLGIRLTSCPSDLYSSNYPTLIAKIKGELQCWGRYMISWIGRVNCIKMNVLPRLLYLFQALPAPLVPADIASLQTTIDQFVWNGKQHCVARATLYRPRTLGGLGLPSLFTYYYATQLAQIVAWHSEAGTRRWVDLENAFMMPHGLSRWMWLPRVHRPQSRTLCPTIVNFLRLWDKLAGKCDLATLPSPLTPIFGNKDFALGLDDGPIWSFLPSDVCRLYHLYPNGQLMDFKQVAWDSGHSRFSFLHSHQLRSFATQQHVKAAATAKLTYFERLCRGGTYPRGLISSLYRALTSLLDWRELSYIRAWEADIGETLDSEDWIDIWDMSCSVSICTSLQEQATKTVIRWYVTPTQLARYDPNVPDVCWRLYGNRGTYYHM